jgi:Leucine-rich repeat (LRR) protein
MGDRWPGVDDDDDDWLRSRRRAPSPFARIVDDTTLQIFHADVSNNKDASSATRLELLFVSEFTPEKWAHLRELKLDRCRAVTHLDAIPSLTSLELDYCDALRTISGAFPALQTLKLEGNQALYTLSMSAPCLTGLNVAFCPSLPRVPSLLLGRLEKLRIDGELQSGLVEHALQHVPTTLRELLIGGCNLQNITIDHIVGLENLGLLGSRDLTNIDCVERLPILKTLQIRWCCNLKTISVPKSLVALTIIRCDALTDLPVGLAFCDNLKRVDVDMCKLMNKQFTGTHTGKDISILLSRMWGIKS